MVLIRNWVSLVLEMADMLPRLQMRRNIPAYIIADLNTWLYSLNQNCNYLMGSELVTLIHQDIIAHIGLDFETYVSGKRTRLSICHTRKQEYTSSNKEH